MKIFKILILLILLTLTQSCKDDKLVDFARDVIKHPEKIYDLKKNYPEFYSENYIDSTWQDSAKFIRIIDFINEYRNIDADETIIFDLAMNRSFEKFINCKVQDFELKDCYILWFQKKDKMVVFSLIKKQDKFFIHFISQGTDYSYYDFHPEEK